MVRLREVLTYRGRAGQWAWILHRVTGVGVLLFLLVHIVDTAFIGWGPELYNKAMAVYRLSVFRVGEVLRKVGPVKPGDYPVLPDEFLKKRDT